MTPPAEGREARGQNRIEEANAEALRRIVAAQPHLVDLKPAGEVIPELGERDLLHAAGIRLLPANDYHAGGTYAGVIARGTPVFVVENRAGGTRACAALNEGRGKALRYGANDPDTLARLAWLEGEFAAILGAAVRLSGGIDLFDLQHGHCSPDPRYRADQRRLREDPARVLQRGSRGAPPGALTLN